MSPVAVVLLLCCFLPVVQTDVILGEEIDVLDGYPGLTRILRFYVDGGRDFCLYFDMEKHSTVYLIYEVLRGGNKLIDMFINSPSTVVLKSVIGNDTGFFHETAKETGVHSVCLDNTSQRFYSKLVHLYIHIHIQESWDKYINEINAVINTTEIFTESLTQVQNSIIQARQHALQARMAYTRDFYHLTYNGDRVSKYSLAMCVIIVMTSVLQVFFVRRLFNVTSLTPTHKPRA